MHTTVQLLSDLVTVASGACGDPTPVRVEGWRAIGSLANSAASVVMPRFRDEILPVLLQVCPRPLIKFRVFVQNASRLSFSLCPSHGM
jgi:hypothetical protein